MASKIFRYAGFGEEDTFGTAVAAAIHTDITGASLDAPDDPNIYYPGGLGRARRVVRPGYYAPTGNVVQGIDVDSIAYLLRWALGGYSYDDPTHSIWGNESNTLLPSFTTRVGKDLFEHVFAGCVMNSLQLQADDSYAQVTADITAQKDSKADLAELDALELPDEVNIAFHEITLESGLVTASVRSFELNIENNVDAADGRGVGSRHPYRLPAGERIVSATFGLWFEDLSQKEKFWGNATGPAAGGATEFALQLKMTPTGEAAKDITIDLPVAIVSTNSHQPSERNRMDESINVQAMVGEVDDTETDIMVKVRNTIGSLNGIY